MKSCRLCGKRIWDNILYNQLYFTYNIKVNETPELSSGREWQEYEHDECSFRFSDKSLRFKAEQETNMKCRECKGILNWKVPPSLEGKIIKLITWVCPFCQTENKDYYPVIKP